MSEAIRQGRVFVAAENTAEAGILQAFLAEVDCNVAVAKNGPDLLAEIAAFQPDVILLGGATPGPSGFEVCKQLKANALTRSIMILMVTASIERGDVERAIEAGVDDFLSKPILKAELLARVGNMLKLRFLLTRLPGGAL